MESLCIGSDIFSVIRTKKSLNRSGRAFEKNALYKLLTNVTYIGKVKYKEEVQRLQDEQRALTKQIREDHKRLHTIAASPLISDQISGLTEIQRRIQVAATRQKQIACDQAALESSIIDSTEIERALGGFDEVWDAMPPKKQIRLIGLLIEAVTFDGPGGIVAITFHATGLKSLTESQLEHAQ